MKKLLVASVLALAVTMASQQTASAWSEFKFSAGVNMGWVGGGNRLFWGLYRSAPYPGGPDLGPYFPGLAAAYSGAGYAPYAPYDGYAPYSGHPVPHADAGPAAPAGQMPAVTGVPHTYNPYFNTGYQPVGYAYPGYAAPQVPAYWYGR